MPLTKTCSQPGNCRGGHTRTSRAPAVKTILRAYRTKVSTGEMISRPAAPVRAAGQGRWPCRREADFETRPEASLTPRGARRSWTCCPRDRGAASAELDLYGRRLSERVVHGAVRSNREQRPAARVGPSGRDLDPHAAGADTGRPVCSHGELRPD